MAGQRPQNFPLKTVLDGTEELYTQTGGVNFKLLVDQIVQRANASSLSPLEFTFTNITSYTANHNLNRKPIIMVAESAPAGFELDITESVVVSYNNTSLKIESNIPISGKVYVF